MYKRCPKIYSSSPSIPYCPCNPTQPISGAIPESLRIKENVCAVKPTDTSLVTSIPVLVVSDTTPVQVGTTSASRTIQQRATNTINASLNPYDPNIRFNSYFPAPPLPYVCPVRIPTYDALVKPCVPITRFQGSAPGR